MEDFFYSYIRLRLKRDMYVDGLVSSDLECKSVLWWIYCLLEAKLLNVFVDDDD